MQKMTFITRFIVRNIRHLILKNPLKSILIEGDLDAKDQIFFDEVLNVSLGTKCPASALSAFWTKRVLILTSLKKCFAFMLRQLLRGILPAKAYLLTCWVFMMTTSNRIRSHWTLITNHDISFLSHASCRQNVAKAASRSSVSKFLVPTIFDRRTPLASFQFGKFGNLIELGCVRV